MARQMSTVGSFVVKDATGKVKETEKVINFPTTVNQKVDLLEVIPKNTTNQLLPMNGLTQITALYMNPDSKITIRLNDNTAAPWDLAGPLTMQGCTITAIYVTTGPTVDVTLETIMGGL